MSKMRRPSLPDAIRLLLAVALVALLGLRGAKAQTIERVDSVGIMVSDMDRSLDFYTGVPPFEVILETEVEGDAYERLFGVFGMRARTVRLRLGEEEIELIDFLAPEGRPVPVDGCSSVIEGRGGRSPRFLGRFSSIVVTWMRR